MNYSSDEATSNSKIYRKNPRIYVDGDGKRKKNFIDGELINLQIRFSRIIEKSATATAELNAGIIFDDDVDVAKFFVVVASLSLVVIYSPHSLAELAVQTYFISIAHFRYRRFFFIKNKNHRTLFPSAGEWKAGWR